MPLNEMHVQEATRPAIDQWWSEKDAACYRSVGE